MSKVARRTAQTVQAQEAVMTSLAVAGAAAVAAAATEPACARCAHRADGRDALEQRIAGLVVFSSGFGASVAGSRLCLLHDRLVSPDDACGRFEARA